MLSLCLAPILSLMGAAPLPPAPPKLPESPAPQFTTVASIQVAMGQLVCSEAVLVPKAVLVQREIEVMGMKRTITERITEYVTETRYVSHSLKDGKAQTADGKPLTAEELVKRLTPGTPILLMNGSDKVDPVYLKIVKPDTVIFFPAQPKVGIPPVPRPLPVPEPLPDKRQP